LRIEGNLISNYYMEGFLKLAILGYGNREPIFQFSFMAIIFESHIHHHLHGRWIGCGKEFHTCCKKAQLYKIDFSIY
jgi:hypothetical protein